MDVIDDSDSSDNKSLVSRKYVTLPKSCLLEAIETILQSPREKKLVGRKAKIVAEYNRQDATNVDSNCSNRSHLPIYSSRISHKTEASLMPILNEIRFCLLAGDWDGYKELLLILFSSPNIANAYILYAIRSCFILLFNHPYRTPDMLDDFMASCLRINDKSRRIQYLEGCFSLKGDSTYTMGINIKKEKEKEKEIVEEEEEMIFHSDFSSDENV